MRVLIVSANCKYELHEYACTLRTRAANTNDEPNGVLVRHPETSNATPSHPKPITLSKRILMNRNLIWFASGCLWTNTPCGSPLGEPNWHLVHPGWTKTQFGSFQGEPKPNLVHVGWTKQAFGSPSRMCLGAALQCWTGLIALRCFLMKLALWICMCWITLGWRLAPECSQGGWNPVLETWIQNRCKQSLECI